MFVFGRPYFSGNSLIRTFKFDPPPYQTTSSFLTTKPGPIDPSNPHNDPPHILKKMTGKGGKWKWPPDPLRLYYSPFSPHDPLLSLDSRRGQSFVWRQDRWYVDMRGDVDQEGWEYAFYWNGRWRWCGGNWHGQAMFVHAWVRRRKWIRELMRKNVSPVHSSPPEPQTPVWLYLSQDFGIEVNGRHGMMRRMTIREGRRKKLEKSMVETSTS